MSVEAVAYVKKLKVAPTGEAITRSEKLLLFVLGDCHNSHRRVAWPSMATMAEEALMDEKWVRQLLGELQRKRVVGCIPPEKNGRGYTAKYWFCEIDPDPQIQRPIPDTGRGHPLPPFESTRGNSVPPFSPAKRGNEGGTILPKRGNEGGIFDVRNKEELEQKQHGTKTTTREATPARLSDKRHAPLREAIQRVQRRCLGYPVWDKSADKKLAEMLDSVPECTIEDLVVAVVWWALSPETAHGMHPRLWLPHLPAYQQGPLKSFKPYIAPGDVGGWNTKRNFEELLAVAKGGDIVQQHLAARQEAAG